MGHNEKTDIYGHPVTTSEGNPIFTGTMQGDYTLDSWGQPNAV